MITLGLGLGTTVLVLVSIISVLMEVPTVDSFEPLAQALFAVAEAIAKTSGGAVLAGKPTGFGLAPSLPGALRVPLTSYLACRPVPAYVSRFCRTFLVLKPRPNRL